MPRKKPEFAEEVEEKFEEVWDKRKIIAGIFVLLLFIAGGVIGKRILFHESLAPESFIPTFPSVKGISTFNAPDAASHVKISLPSQEDVTNQLHTIQTQVTNLNVSDIASSSPQVQQILKQIENLPSGPEGQVKAACMRLCNNL